MSVQGPYTYVPVLATRVAELKAVAGLSEVSKNLLTPLFLLRPWPNANELSTAIEKIEESFGDRPFFLSLSRAPIEAKRVKPAHIEFNKLISSEEGYQSYFEFVGQINHASPVLQSEQGFFRDIDRQIEHAKRLNRGLLIHVDVQTTRGIAELYRAVSSAKMNGVSFLFDTGWGGRDLLGFAAIIVSHIRSLREVIPDPQIIVCGSSFPENFQGMGLRRQFPVFERQLHEQVSRQFNDMYISYGDWGSTRPIRPNTPMNTVRRIDLPVPNNWICFREGGDNKSYIDLARAVIIDPEWPANLNLWGIYQILATSQGADGAIQGPSAASAVRINIHLHRQIHYDDPTSQGDTDEPYVD